MASMKEMWVMMRICIDTSMDGLESKMYTIIV